MICHSEYSLGKQLLKNPPSHLRALFLRVISGKYFESEFILLLKGSETLVEIRSPDIVDKRASTPAEIRWNSGRLSRNKVITYCRWRSQNPTKDRIIENCISRQRSRHNTLVNLRSSSIADEIANTLSRIGSWKIEFPDRGAGTPVSIRSSKNWHSKRNSRRTGKHKIIQYGRWKADTRAEIGSPRIEIVDGGADTDNGADGDGGADTDGGPALLERSCVFEQRNPNIFEKHGLMQIWFVTFPWCLQKFIPSLHLERWSLPLLFFSLLFRTSFRTKVCIPPFQ